MNKVSYTVSAICTSCTSCYRENCSRGDWSKAVIISIPPVGADKVCPLVSIKARKLATADSVSEADTWAVCRKCQHTEDGEIAPDSYVAHCLDCPVQMARESLRETSAEASVS